MRDRHHFHNSWFLMQQHSSFKLVSPDMLYYVPLLLVIIM